jgi:hypothetical protein
MILTILKYLGLCLAASSSIWGLTHELTIKTADNRKRLTKAGIVSILFIAFGLVLSIISDDIGRKHAAKDQFKKVAAEARRTNEIIIASQPLTSLSFVLQFESSDTSLRKKMEEGNREIQENDSSVQGGVPRVPYEAIEYRYNLIPMMKFLGRLGYNKQKDSKANEEDEKNDLSDSNGIVALIPLDDAPNSILSFGEISGQAAWDDGDSAHRLSAGLSPQSGSILPFTTKEFPADGPSKYAIKWNLDPITLENSVDRANSEIRSGAKLPRVLNFVILGISETIPFAYNNFAITTSNPWHGNAEKDKIEIRNVSNMTLTAIVNGFSELEYHYKLVGIYHKPLYNDSGEVIEIGCTILEFRLD